MKSTEYNKSIIRDESLAAQGREMIRMAEQEMPGLIALRERFGQERPLGGVRITGSLHLTVETAVLIETLRALGAEVRWASSNVLSTNDAAAAALAAAGTPVFAMKGTSIPDYWRYTMAAFTFADGAGPDQIVDDGGDAALMLHEGLAAELDPRRLDRAPASEDERAMFEVLKRRQEEVPDFWRRTVERCRGLSEETTTGVLQLRKWDEAKTLRLPAFDVNEAVTKSKMDNIYGCRESLVDAIKRATDVMIAGKTAVVCGFGHVGKGSAEALAAHRAQVWVTEIDPICGLQAALSGFRVVRLNDALPHADIYVTATGNCDVITMEHLAAMKTGAIVCNIGHFNYEIQMMRLDEHAEVTRTRVKDGVDRYSFPNGHYVYVLGEGRLVNLACATGHPAFVMSCSFTNQVFAQLELHSRARSPGVYRLDKRIDEEVARLHLEAIGGALTQLDEAQATYIGVPVEGPFKASDYRY